MSNIKTILEDDDFEKLVTRLRDQLTGKVMSKSASEDERKAAYDQFHALNALLGTMRAEANNQQKD